MLNTGTSIMNSKCHFLYITASIITVLLCKIISSQEIYDKTRYSSQNVICSLSQNCSDCISHPTCSWCSYQFLPHTIHRCESYAYLNSNNCPEENIINPISNVKILEDSVNVESSMPSNESPIQLHPQRVRLQLRKNEVQRFTLNFEQAENYPIDLYYLMDLTDSMKEHKEQVALLANSLAENMTKITHNFRLGFGSFIDKVVMPFANMVPEKLKNPCINNITCAPPYGFKNHLSLGTNISQFTHEVSSTPMSGNLDNAEGGFDAIMQVITCKEIINWKNMSRKIILFATDSIFHYAGDGKLGGIVDPNDGMCHLDEHGFYTESINQDYPSLEQITKIVTNHKINIIFAVPEKSVEVYKKLNEHIPGSTTGILEEDSSNIVDIISDNFKKIAAKIELRDTSSSSVEVRYMSSCLGNYKHETHTCDHIGTGQKISFDVEIKVTDCPVNGSETFVISPTGIGEYTVIELDVVCDCECELEPKAVANSQDCSGNGTLACGICACDHNRFGKNCECDGDDAIRQDLLDLCKRDNTSQLCMGRGSCVCGVCQCNARTETDIISGEYCECDTFSCGRDMYGLSCGGPRKGICCDGKCFCSTGWTGDLCDCSTINDTCINAEQSDKICSGNGECYCGKCRCDDEHYGEYCQDCESCEGRCDELQQCVECKVFNGGLFSPVECREKCTYHIELTQSLDSRANDRSCIYVDVEGCRINFNYNYRNDNELYLRVLEERQCQTVVSAYVVLGSVVLIVFLLGLIALLIFKCCIYWKDKQEYEKWLEEVKKLQQNLQESPEGNPLFVPASKEFKNPTYGSAE